MYSRYDYMQVCNVVNVEFPPQYQPGQPGLEIRAAQPFEFAPMYLYLASDDSSFVVGQTLHVNGGEIFGL